MQDKRSEREQNLSVRQFREGDEQLIVELFNTVHLGYSGFVPRTIEYWRWCCLERPDVEKEGILLAFDGERLRGYLVAGLSGNIWEFCVASDERRVARILLSEAMSYLEKKEASSISVNIPRQAAISKELREAGFGEVPGLEMFVTTINPEALVEVLAKSQGDILRKGLEGEFSFRLRDAPYGTSREFSVRIRDSSVEVGGAFPSRPSAIVELKFMDFLSVLFRGSSALRFLLYGKLKVRPLWKAGAVLTLLSAIRLNDYWFFPLSDSA